MRFFDELLNPADRALYPSFSLHLNGAAQLTITGTDKIEWIASEFDTNSDVNFSITLDNAAAVDKGGGLVGIPSTAHGLSVDENFTISGTTNYNGAEDVISVTANEIVITASYVAETFAGTETCTVATFKPTIAGKYLLSVSLTFIAIVDGDSLFLYLYKNGTLVNTTRKEANTNVDQTANLTVVVDANGSTDYFEIFAQNSGRDTSNISGSITGGTHWTGSRIS